MWVAGIVPLSLANYNVNTSPLGCIVKRKGLNKGFRFHSQGWGVGGIITSGSSWRVPEEHQGEVVVDLCLYV